MNKYGVETDAPDKTAATGGIQCPVCGEEAERDGTVVKCPRHGTAPWENPTHREDPPPGDESP